MPLPVPHPALSHYAAFVWPAYGASALVIAALVAESLLRARRWRKAAQDRPAARPPRS